MCLSRFASRLLNMFLVGLDAPCCTRTVFVTNFLAHSSEEEWRTQLKRFSYRALKVWSSQGMHRNAYQSLLFLKNRCQGLIFEECLLKFDFLKESLPKVDFLKECSPKLELLNRSLPQLDFLTEAYRSSMFLRNLACFS